MITCKFFLQGTCKFGDSCRYSHQISDTPQTQGPSIMRNNSKPPQIDTNLLVKSVVNDMTNAEKGGHWLLSSYAPFKDKPCFPGFENRSFEEVRLGYYEAMKNSTVEQYKQQLQMMLQDAIMKMKVLQNPSNEIISMLVQIYNTPVHNQGSTTAPGVFGQQAPSNSLFGQQQESSFQQNHSQPTSIFALANQQLFGKNTTQQQSNFTAAPTNTNTIFPGAAVQSSNQSIFGGGNSIFNKQQTFTGNNNAIGSIIGSNQNFVTNTQSNSPFGATTQQNNSPFGTTNNTLSAQQNNSPFGVAQQNNIFNQSNNAFSTQTQALPFQNQTNTNSLFHNQSPTNSAPTPANTTFNFATAAAANISSSPFIQQPQQPNIFTTNAPQQNTSPFQQQPHTNTANIFNNSPTGGNVFKDATSIFGNNQSINSEQKSTASIFAQDSAQTVINLGSGINDSSAYSKLEDLTENEIKWFESESFEFGKIPEKPPTAQMCL